MPDPDPTYVLIQRRQLGAGKIELSVLLRGSREDCEHEREKTLMVVTEDEWESSLTGQFGG